MGLIKWEALPDTMKTPEVREYYQLLEKKPLGLAFKRLFDIVISLFLLVALMPIMVIIGILIKLDSKGPVIFKQVRVTTGGKEFKIWKFRTMVTNAEAIGTQVTVGEDPRITKMGRILRKVRLDEFPQLVNVLKGEMSFVGTRPEVPRYVQGYTKEMWATLLLPAGITSKASIEYKDEEQLLSAAANPDEVYLSQVLPEKMKYNLEYLKNYHFMGDISLMVQTVIAVLK